MSMLFNYHILTFKQQNPQCSQYTLPYILLDSKSSLKSDGVFQQTMRE